jgi:hypothetical protein
MKSNSIKTRAFMAGIVSALSMASLSNTTAFTLAAGTVAKASSANSDPALQQKQSPGDKKSNRLGGGRGYRLKIRAYCGKRVRHTVAQGRRIAVKKRNIKRHRARS